MTTKPGTALPLSEALTPTQALGVALSVQAGAMAMDEAQERAPDMLDHLHNMGFDVRAARSQPDEGLLREARRSAEAACLGALRSTRAGDLSDAPEHAVRTAHAALADAAAPLAGETGPRLDVELLAMAMAADANNDPTMWSLVSPAGRNLWRRRATVIVHEYDLLAANHPVAEAGER